jgi:beta-1,2-mannobiose phosphorylase / 1,2-beta-oligomannan phosphorylase
MFSVTRDPHNPLINPDLDQPWYAEAAFNPSPIVHDGKLNLIFRAATHPALYTGQPDLELSTIGIATAAGQSGFEDIRQLVTPEQPWEQYGCEDPRVTKIGHTYYIFYTALGGYPFGPDNIKVAVATTKDLKTIEARHLVTPFNAKAMALFPESHGGKLRAILTVNSDLPPSSIAIAEFDRPEDIWSPYYWERWYNHLEDHTLDLKRGDGEHVEVGAPPLWTPEGWLLIYADIQDYFTDHKTFGIEAALLDLEDPTKVLRRTVYPFMVPEEGYERYGRLPKIIFPSGALRHGDTLELYYGGTDTTCCRASLNFSGLMASLSPNGVIAQTVQRTKANPILTPIAEHPWESSHVLNPTAIELEGKTHILYRAVGPENTSVIGYARSNDGVHINERLAEPIYVPRADFEQKHGGPNDNSGCEDGRITRIGDRLYLTYTAYDSVTAPHVAESSISVGDFLTHNWSRWTMPTLISPDGVDDKDACLVPEEFKGRYMVLHRVSNHICADYVTSLNFRNEKLTRCIQILGPRPGMWDSQKVGIAGPPVKTPAGWLLFYHGITSSGAYCLGAALLDRRDPTRLLGRSAEPLMTPVEPYEREGWISNVVFPCGQVVKGDTVYLYYGGADHVIGVATVNLNELITSLSPLR